MMLSADLIVEAVATLLVLAHIGALIWSGFLRKGIAPVLALNAIVSGGVAVYWAPQIPELLQSADLMLAFVGFELFVLGTSLLATTRVRVPHALIWFAFVAHAGFVMLALAFMFTFKINRLI